MLYALFAVNAFLTWSGLVHANPATAITLRVVFGLGYAFGPLLAAVFGAWLLTKTPTTRKAFLTNLEIAWSLTLALAGLTFVASLEL